MAEAGSRGRETGGHIGQKEPDAWIRTPGEQRLLQSGMAIVSRARTVFDAEEDSRVTLVVHNVRPPFLQTLPRSWCS